jgi:hypothetical protein
LRYLSALFFNVRAGVMPCGKEVMMYQQGTIHPRHRPQPLAKVWKERSYPTRVATGPIKRYIKARLGRGDYDAGLIEAVRRTFQTAWHCYPRHNDVIWATVQRSGHNWVSLIYTLLMESLFFARAIDIDNIAEHRAGFYRHIPIRYDLGDHRTRFHNHLPVPRLMHTHDPFYRWMSARKILLQVRHPRDVLISKYIHGRFAPHTPFQDYLQTATVAGLVSFYNSWGQALAAGCLKGVYCLKYEHMRENPVEEMQQVLAFLDLPQVSGAMIEEALDKTTPEHVQQLAQAGRTLGDDKLLYNIRGNRPEDKARITPADYEQLDAFIRQQIVYRFDYTL